MILFLSLSMPLDSIISNGRIDFSVIRKRYKFIIDKVFVCRIILFFLTFTELLLCKVLHCIIFNKMFIT